MRARARSHTAGTRQLAGGCPGRCVQALRACSGVELLTHSLMGKAMNSEYCLMRDCGAVRDRVGYRTGRTGSQVPRRASAPLAGRQPRLTLHCAPRPRAAAAAHATTAPLLLTPAAGWPLHTLHGTRQYPTAKQQRPWPAHLQPVCVCKLSSVRLQVKGDAGATGDVCRRVLPDCGPGAQGRSGRGGGGEGSAGSAGGSLPAPAAAGTEHAQGRGAEAALAGHNRDSGSSSSRRRQQQLTHSCKSARPPRSPTPTACRSCCSWSPPSPVCEGSVWEQRGAV